MARLIIFIHQDSGEKGQFFLKVIEQKVGGNNLYIFQKISMLEKEFSSVRPYLDKQIVVLFVDSKKRLKRLYSKKSIFQDKKVVIILPRADQIELSMAHKFLPRYFTRIDESYDDLCDVLNKMLNQ